MRTVLPFGGALSFLLATAAGAGGVDISWGNRQEMFGSPSTPVVPRSERPAPSRRHRRVRARHKGAGPSGPGEREAVRTVYW